MRKVVFFCSLFLVTLNLITLLDPSNFIVALWSASRSVADVALGVGLFLLLFSITPQMRTTFIQNSAVFGGILLIVAVAIGIFFPADISFLPQYISFQTLYMLFVAGVTCLIAGLERIMIVEGESDKTHASIKTTPVFSALRTHREQVVSPTQKQHVHTTTQV